MWAVVDVFVGEAQDGVAGGFERAVAVGVLAAGAGALVAGAVGFDDEVEGRPVEVDLEARDDRVAQRLLDSELPDEAAERALEAALGAGAAVSL